MWEGGGISPLFLPLALDGWEGSASRAGRFTLGEKAHSIYCIGSFVDLKAGLDNVNEIKIFRLYRESNTGRLARSPPLYWLSYPAQQLNDNEKTEKLAMHPGPERWNIAITAEVRAGPNVISLGVLCLFHGRKEAGIPRGYGLLSQGSITGRGNIFFSTPQRPDRLWIRPSLLYNGYRYPFPRG